MDIEKQLKKQAKKVKMKKFSFRYKEIEDGLCGNEQDIDAGGNVLAKRSKVPVVVCAVCVAFAVICLAVILTVILNNGNKNSDLTFGDDDVYTVSIDDSTYTELADNYAFINKMQVTEQAEIRLRQDDSVVMYIIRGELETDSDYYFIDILFEENSNYHFGYRSVYENLENEIQVDGWCITYDQNSTDAGGLYVYMFRLVNNDGQVVYMEIHCFENDISYILSDFIE